MAPAFKLVEEKNWMERFKEIKKFIERRKEDRMEKSKRERVSVDGLGKISLMLDDYNDIFSDFDPRPNLVRSLSVDFLDEIKRATRDKKEGLDLSFLIPQHLREIKEETVIKKRLKNHFKKHYETSRQEVKSVVREGILFVAFGVVLMFLATYILFTFKESTFLTTFLVVILEPAGWFLFWEGLDLIIFEPKKRSHELVFYKKMTRAKIYFNSC